MLLSNTLTWSFLVAQLANILVITREFIWPGVVSAVFAPQPISTVFVFVVRLM